MAEPLDRRLESEIVQVHRQVNGPAAAHSLIPVHELGGSAGDRAFGRMPFGLIVAISLRSGQQENLLQGNAADPIGPVSNLLESHGSWLSFGLRLTQFFMLMT